MKRIMIYIFACLVILMAGCGKEKVKTSDSGFNIDTDDQNFSIMKEAVYSNDGFYVFNQSKNVIEFVDKKTNKAVPLCSKPNCSHSDSNCDAFFETINGIYVYEGHIYVMAYDRSSNNVCLYRMNMDGSERTEIRKLYNVEDDDKGYSIELILHRGYGYLWVRLSDGDVLTKDKAVLYRISLDSDDKTEILSLNDYEAFINIVNVEGDNIYISTDHYKKPNISSGIEDKGYCYNINDQELEELQVPENQSFDASYNGKLYSMHKERDSETLLDKKLEFYESDMDGSNNKCVYSLENVYSSLIYRDAKYRYITLEEDGKYCLLVITYDGKEMCKITEDFAYYIVWSDMENILFRADPDSSNYVLYNIKTGKKTEITGSDQ